MPFGVEIRQLGGALAREPVVPNAVGHRRGAVTVYTTAYSHPGGPRASDGVAEQALLDDLMLLTHVHTRLLLPGLAQLADPDPPAPSTLRTAANNYRRALDQLTQDIGLAAA